MELADNRRHYRIDSLLGSGGFGKVYLATLQGAGGFSKRVAIKVLHDDAAPQALLRRFRDEARLLGLVRDRAIVGVDPPVTIRDRWAIVMEYVEGRSCEELLEHSGPLPPAVAAEIIGEIARVLDKVWQAPGPDGRPLRLLHRDIKPENIQVTRDGEVKLLDFGIARADFDTREYHTRKAIGGTPGFIAPERMHGEEGPPGDVYSLGVTLHVLLTGKRPRLFGGFANEAPATMDVADDSALTLPEEAEVAEPERREALALATRMRAPVPSDRPTAREVERACRDLRGRSAGAWLRDWAETQVNPTRDVQTDDWAGTVVTVGTIETLSSPVALAPKPKPKTTRFSALLLVVGLAAMAVAVVGAGGLGAAWWWRAHPAAVPRVAVTAAPPVAAPAPEAPAAVAPPEPVAPAPVASVEAPRTAVQAPAPAAAEVRQYAVRIVSRPLGATVYVDGAAAGVTPMQLTLDAGVHVVRLTGADATLEKSVTVGARGPTRYSWDTKAGTWEAGY